METCKISKNHSNFAFAMYEWAEKGGSSEKRGALVDSLTVEVCERRDNLPHMY